MKNAILFDLDGTLLDTLTDLQESLNSAMIAFGVPSRSLAEVRRFVGNGLPKLVERALPDGRAHPNYDAVLSETRRIYQQNSRNNTKPYEGILPMLQQLSSFGYHMGIVSNKPDAEVKRLCKHYFADTITVAIGANDTHADKPAPDNLYAAMQELGVTAAETVYVGDSDVDIDTARNTGLPCISVTWGFRDMELLMAHGAAFLIRHPSELPGLLRSGFL